MRLLIHIANENPRRAEARMLLGNHWMFAKNILQSAAQQLPVQSSGYGPKNLFARASLLQPAAPETLSRKTLTPRARLFLVW